MWKNASAMMRDPAAGTTRRPDLLGMGIAMNPPGDKTTQARTG
jgi:hypothetical protein